MAGERAGARPYQSGQLEKPYEQTNKLFEKLFRSRANRPYCMWGAIQGLKLAKVLGLAKVSFIEFGVAGDLGLLDLEEIAATLKPVFGIAIEVHGFDSGIGLPKPTDYRDMPNAWREGFYPMDQLHIGPVEETVIGSMESRPAPFAFISFDLDHYTSTVQASTSFLRR